MSDVEDFDGLLGLALPRDSQNPRLGTEGRNGGGERESAAGR